MRLSGLLYTKKFVQANVNLYFDTEEVKNSTQQKEVPWKQLTLSYRLPEFFFQINQNVN